jgi:ABC-type multidrug transport system permease subunit
MDMVYNQKEKEKHVCTINKYIVIAIVVVVVVVVVIDLFIVVIITIGTMHYFWLMLVEFSTCVLRIVQWI